MSNDITSRMGMNKTQGYRNVSGYISKKECGSSFCDDFLETLMQYHPTKDFSKGGLIFRKCISKPFNKVRLFVEARDGTLLESSWKKCVDNYFGKYTPGMKKKPNSLAALRHAVFDASPKFHTLYKELMKNSQPCIGCGKTCKLTIDHYNKPFAEIVDEFLASNNLSLKTLHIQHIDGVFVLADDILKKRWITYHDEVADLAGLCGSCNSAKGSCGYRHNK